MGKSVGGVLGFGSSKTKASPVLFQNRGDPNRDLLFNREESRGFSAPAFGAIGDLVGLGGSQLGQANQFLPTLKNSITNRNFSPSRNEENLIRETIDQINSNQAVLTGGPPTSGTIGRAIGGQLAQLDQQDIQNQMGFQNLLQSQGANQLQLAMQAALGLGQLNDPSKLLSLGNTQNTKKSGLQAGLNF